MKYGESIFDILYLLFAIIAGLCVLIKAKTKAGKAMGFASMVLGVGDAFHLIPRVLSYFIDKDLTCPLGCGKMITSITMTLFYLILFCIWIVRYKNKYSVALSIAVTVLTAARIVLCFFPQNGWCEPTTDITWSIIRNIPFVLLGLIICILYLAKAKEDKYLSPMWAYILLSFAFYVPVVLFVHRIPMLGMLMIPKTICYVLMIVSFILFVKNGEAKNK